MLNKAFDTYIFLPSCSSAAGGDTRWGPLPAWEAAPCLGKVLFPEQNFSARESLKLPSSGSPGLNSYPSDHFHASNVKERKEVGPETETVICLVTTLPGPGLGRNGNLENVAKRFVSVFSKQCLLHVPCLGVGHG